MRLLVAGAVALVAWFVSAHGEVFDLDRGAIHSGELWRLWTGHLVHGSKAHFNYDVGTAALLGVAFGWPRAVLWLAPVASVALLAALPDVTVYYGLSSLLHAWVISIAMQLAATGRGTRRILAHALWMGVLAKAGAETWLQASLLTESADFGGPVLHASHFVGALLGIATGLRRSRDRLR